MNKEERDNLVRYLFEETELTLQQMATYEGLSYKIVWNTVERIYSDEIRRARKARNYSKTRSGKNYGLTKENHPSWIGGEVGDGNGYTMVLKPDWFTGRAGSKYVFKHTVVMCQALGLTELPKGFIVHHIDENKQNNEINNLAIMTNGAHMKLHALLRRVTTISEESRT